MDETSETLEDIQTVTLVQELSWMLGSRCKECMAILCGHELLMCIVTGYRHSLRCLRCLSRAMGKGKEEARDDLYRYIMHRDCRREAWSWASREEGFATEFPACLWSGTDQDKEGYQHGCPPEAHDFLVRNLASDVEWNAGNMGCGKLVMELRLRLSVMSPGKILKLTATDNGASEDIPAWCRLTGHKLLSTNQPEYWIQRREK